MASVEDLQEAVRVLVAERQALHACDADRAELEANRLELVRPQQQLSHAQGAQGPPGATGAQGAQGAPGQPATKLFVALDADGTLTKNSGATLATRAGAGVYRISFDTDITNCVYLATGGQDAGSLIEDYHLYTSRTATNTVNVAIFDAENDPLDRL